MGEDPTLITTRRSGRFHRPERAAHLLGRPSLLRSHREKKVARRTMRSGGPRGLLQKLAGATEKVGGNLLPRSALRSPGLALAPLVPTLPSTPTSMKSMTYEPRPPAGMISGLQPSFRTEKTR